MGRKGLTSGLMIGTEVLQEQQDASPYSVEVLAAPDRAGRQEVRSLPLDKVNLDDQTFRYRVELSVNGLSHSLLHHGLQVPIIVRPCGSEYQVVCGFRRATAAKQLGWDKIPAIVRKDLADDVAAARVSVVENQARATYTDLDRASAICALRRLNLDNREIERVFGIGRRQRQRLEKLLSFPDEVRKAVESGLVPSSLAIRLMQHMQKHPGSDMCVWLQWIREGASTYRQLDDALAGVPKKAAGPRPVRALFAATRAPDGSMSSLVLRRVSVRPSWTREQRDRLISELLQVISLLSEEPAPSLKGGVRH